MDRKEEGVLLASVFLNEDRLFRDTVDHCVCERVRSPTNRWQSGEMVSVRTAPRL